MAPAPPKGLAAGAIGPAGAVFNTSARLPPGVKEEEESASRPKTDNDHKCAFHAICETAHFGKSELIQYLFASEKHHLFFTDILFI